MSRPRIIFDTDPGADDAIALLWLTSLHHAGRIELAAITTAGGNVGRRQVFDNAARLCALAGLPNLPIARGVRHDGPDAVHVHGEDGLAGRSALLPKSALSFDAAPRADRLLADVLLARPGDATLVAVGPLTNLAAAERRRPGCLGHAARIVTMGGALAGGNITPHAEFNVFHNAAAWRQVLAAAQLDVVPLDVTRTVALAAADLPDLPRAGAQSAFFLALARTMVASTAARGQAPGFLLHDAVAVAAACVPGLVRFRDAALEVHVADDERHGQLTERASSPATARLAIAAQRDALVHALLADLLDP